MNDRTIRETGDIVRRCIFWGKYDKAEHTCLPLAAHGLDVGLVFRALCDLPGIRRSLTRAAPSWSISDETLDRVAVMAALHDIGKANIGFQSQIWDLSIGRPGHVAPLAPIFDPYIRDPHLHAAFLDALPAEMAEWFPDDDTAYSYFIAALSHHGRPVLFQGSQGQTFLQARDQWWTRHHNIDPFDGVRQVLDWARKSFPRAFIPGHGTLPPDPAFQHRFAGLLMLADWLGSHSAWFPIGPESFSHRYELDTTRIPTLLRVTGLDPTVPRAWARQQDIGFKSLFGMEPRPIQKLAGELDVSDPDTRLVIVESETGSGKTEAALQWFYRLFAAGVVDSLYFALPTRVAALQLYQRVAKVVAQWFPDEEIRPLTVLAVPCYMPAAGLDANRVLPDEPQGTRWEEDPRAEKHDRYWAAERPKRFLAAPIAVGTVDQALLSIVQTKHAHLRSVCLDRSLLVVDEVHASDSYMSHLLATLLKHHASVGGRAMLLSATLGATARTRYVNSASAQHEAPPPIHEAVTLRYPCVTLSSGRLFGARSSKVTKTVSIETLPAALDPSLAARQVLQALEAGARVLAVFNTVPRAINFLKHLEASPDVQKSWFFQTSGVVGPHHGRFAPADRRVLDAAVTWRLGKASSPGPVLVVGTQTLEQSLDIDADWLVTDLVPGDVLLQRVGRLHRHAERDRPEGFRTPRVLVLVPETDLEDALDGAGRVRSVYAAAGYGNVYEDLRMLELTRRYLVERGQIVIPDENRLLVEEVTHPARLETLVGDRWENHAEKVAGRALAQAIAAGTVSAVYGKSFGTPECTFQEAGTQVAIRLGANSLQLPVDFPFVSPFGQVIDELVIPGHMAPRGELKESLVHVEHVTHEEVQLSLAGRRYRYNRYGLEADHESS